VRSFRACIRALRPDLPGPEVDFWGITIKGCCFSHAMRSGINPMIWTEADPDLDLDEITDRLTEFVFKGLQAS
jgi:hypothetical protein